MNIQNPSTADRAVDLFKQMANKLIDTGNNMAVKYGNGGMSPRFQTINDQQANDYQKVVNAKNMLLAGSIKNDPRNNNSIYRGLVATPTPTPTLIKNTNITPTPIQTNRLVPTVIPTNTPTPTPVATSFPNQNYVEQTIFPLTRAQNLPDALVAGQWAAEGRFVNPPNNNLFNLMYNGQLHSYQSLANHIADYALTIKNILQSKGYDMGKMTSDQILKALQEGKTRFEGHNPNPTSYINLVTSTPEYQQYNQMQQIIDKLNKQLKK